MINTNGWHHVQNGQWTYGFILRNQAISMGIPADATSFPRNSNPLVHVHHGMNFNSKEWDEWHGKAISYIWVTWIPLVIGPCPWMKPDGLTLNTSPWWVWCRVNWTKLAFQIGTWIFAICPDLTLHDYAWLAIFDWLLAPPDVIHVLKSTDVLFSVSLSI